MMRLLMIVSLTAFPKVTSAGDAKIQSGTQYLSVLVENGGGDYMQCVAYDAQDNVLDVSVSFASGQIDAIEIDFDTRREIIRVDCVPKKYD